jgi:O-antigen/teichoic acid export membrane protein
MEVKKVKPYNLFKGTLTFTFGALLRKGVNFILLPIYTAALAASGYGALAMLTVFGGIVTMSLNFGLGSAIVVKYKEFKTRGKEKVIENSIITFLLVIILLALSILYLVCPFYAGKLIKMTDSTSLVRLYLLSIASTILLEVFYTFLRIRFQNFKLVIVTLVNFIASTSLIIFFILGLKLGVEGVILGALIPSFLILVYFFAAWGYKPEFDKELFKPLFRFGVWLVPGNLGALIYTFSDRFFLQEYFSLVEVGIYSLAVKLSTMITIFLLKPFRQSFGPYIYQQEGGLQQGTNLGLKFLLTISGLGFLGVSLAGKPIIKIMATREFLPAASIIPILLLAEVANGVIQIFRVGILKAGKSYIGSMIIWTGAVLNIGLNFLLIPEYKIFGASLATLITYFVMIGSYFYFSNKEFKLNIDYRFVISIIAAVSVFYFGGGYIIDSSKYILLKLIEYGLVMVCFLITIYLLLGNKEKLNLRNLVKQKVARKADFMIPD